MAQHRCRGRRSAGAALGRPRAAPRGLAGEAEADARGELARALARGLAGIVDAIPEPTSRIGRAVLSFPRAGRINAARTLAELGGARARFQTEGQLAAEAGVRPLNGAAVRRARVLGRARQDRVAHDPARHAAARKTAALQA